MARTLVGLVEIIDGKRNWSAAHPYIRTHLGTHAAAAGLIDDLANDAGFLLAADPVLLLSAVDRVHDKKASLAARAYRQAYINLTSTRHEAERAPYLELAARCNGATSIAGQAGQLASAAPWHCRWAAWNERGLIAKLDYMPEGREMWPPESSMGVR